MLGHFKIHKTKSALDVTFARPKITRLVNAFSAQSPAPRSNLWTLKKPGSLRLDFAASRGSGSNIGSDANTLTGYDWKNKLSLQLNVLEMGTLLAFHSNPQATEAKFFHDPNMGTEEAGTVTKELKIIRQGVGTKHRHSFSHS